MIGRRTLNQRFRSFPSNVLILRSYGEITGAAFINSDQFACFCDDKLPWKSEYRYYLLDKLCKTRKCTLNYSLDDWSQNVKTYSSCVPITCKECNVKATSTNISNFARGILHCCCSLKSEHMVRVFLRRYFGENKTVDGKVAWCTNPKLQKTTL